MTLSADLWDRSLWYATAQEPAPETDAPADARVLVVGGGFTGLSCALHLAERGVAVTVIEAREIGFGASGRNGGQVIPGLKIDPSDMRAHWGAKAGGRLAEFAGGVADQVFGLIERHGIACAPTRAGWIQGAHSAMQLRAVHARAREWQAEGAPVALLDAVQMAEATGAVGYAGGWRDERAGMLNPLSYARGLARAARAAGATIVTGSPVTGVVRDGAGWRVDLGGQCLRGETVVLATNAYDSTLRPQLARSVLPVQSCVIATEPLPPEIAASILPQDACASEVRKIAVYYRKTPDGRLAFGGRGATGAAHSQPLQAGLEAQMHRMFPQLDGVRIDKAWSGHLALSRDHLPHIHQIEPGLWAALAYNGRGVAMATGIGAALAARLAEGTPLPLPETPLRPIAWHALRRPAMELGIRYYLAKDRLGLPS
ncbi:FAD-binding oxidoreductase [Salipiger sp. 1_MG-2023]|uniref:NAD(P)/FAD-dependent oxidoreductase n=1 Tax=Salipiger sp. 1_MG-2023 TaxID=3062665 RepID=UPI0026E23907|nr:FAD-binding oxidoreductase [Salipiger sp. 1_MG-2023]MDO6584025.1 FAD-binding oxidoreductase [Salipiger sp. 1_MG-2023]